MLPFLKVHRDGGLLGIGAKDFYVPADAVERVEGDECVALNRTEQDLETS
jgi:hypothetical protein